MASRVCGRAWFVLFMLRYFGLRGIAYHKEPIIERGCARCEPSHIPHRAPVVQGPSGSGWVAEAPRGFLGMDGRLLLARRGRVCV